jgi:hypothetical protein
MKKLIVLFCLILPIAVFAAPKDLEISWDYPGPVAEDLAGFRIYAHTRPDAWQPRHVIATIQYIAGQVVYTTTTTLNSPDVADTTWYFMATAFDQSGNESDPSNTVQLRIDFLPPGSPVNLQIKIFPREQ